MRNYCLYDEDQERLDSLSINYYSTDDHQPYRDKTK
jgi:hypothetical protein